jgi:hypothetical protein
VEVEAKKVGFRPTMVLNALFDTTDRKQLSRRLAGRLGADWSRKPGFHLYYLGAPALTLQSSFQFPTLFVQIQIDTA